MNPFKRTINNGFGDSKLSLPRTGLLLYLGRPNLEASNVPLGDDTIIRWMFLLPADADIRAATGWVSGTGNIFYDAAGDPIAVLASEIAAWSSINQWNVLFHLVSADTETGRLAIYAVDTPVKILDKAMRVLRAPQPDLPSAFFNGMDTTGKTSYTGGPTYAPDHLGVLRTPGAGLPAIEGMRLATTVADGAVLGPELVVNGAFDSDTKWQKEAGWSINVALGVAVAVAGTDSSLYQELPTAQYDKCIVAITANVTAGSVTVRFGDNTGQIVISTTGTHTKEITDNYNGFLKLYKSAAFSGSISLVSVKKVTPTYVSTDISGAPIVASRPQRTRVANADFTAFTPSTTFPRFDTSDPLKMPGLLCEPARTNYLLQNNSLSSWLATNISATVDTGLTILGQQALKILAIATSAAELWNDVSVTGGFVTLSVYMKKGSSATSMSKVQIRNQTTSTTLLSVDINLDTGNIAYSVGTSGCTATLIQDGVYLVSLTAEVTGTTTIRASLGAAGTPVTAGLFCYYSLPQLELGAFPTSRIVTAAATVTRAGTVLTYPTAGKIRSNNMAMRKLIIPKATGQSGVYAYGTYLDANNYTALLMSPTSITLRKRVAGVDTDATVNVTHTSGVPLDIIGIRSATLGMKIAVRSYSAGAWSAWTDGAEVTTVAAKANAIIGTTYQLGALNSVAQFTGNINLFDTLLYPDGITDPMAWAKTHWGVA